MPALSRRQQHGQLHAAGTGTRKSVIDRSRSGTGCENVINHEYALSVHDRRVCPERPGRGGARSLEGRQLRDRSVIEYTKKSVGPVRNRQNSGSGPRQPGRLIEAASPQLARMERDRNEHVYLGIQARSMAGEEFREAMSRRPISVVFEFDERAAEACYPPLADAGSCPIAGQTAVSRRFCDEGRTCLGFSHTQCAERPAGWLSATEAKDGTPQ